MTNKEWLDYLAHNAPDELSAWFDAEHVETEERALDGDTAALNVKIAELTAERDEWKSRCEKGKAQFDAILAERELYREALSQLLDTVTDGMSKVSAILDNYDEGMA